MAAGDMHIFDNFLEDVGHAIHQLETETFKIALISSLTTPAEDTTIPHFGGTGTTDMSANELTGTGYTAGGTDISGTYSQTTGTATFDGGTPITFSQQGDWSANARWGIIYNDQAAKECVAYMDLGDVDLTAGDLTITWGAGGIFTATSTAGT